MTVKEAYKRVQNKLASFAITECYEYADLYVFTYSPNKSSDKKIRFITMQISVNKTTGEIRDFKPFNISVEDYNNGKKIIDFQ